MADSLDDPKVVQRLWWRAFALADTGTLAAHSSPTLRLTLSSGRTLDRNGTLAEAASYTTGGRLRMEWSDESVRALGDGRTVAVSARMLEADGRTISHFRYLTVMERTDAGAGRGAWRVAVVQSTREAAAAARVPVAAAGPLASYAGRYRLPNGAALVVGVADSTLTLSEPSGAVLHLEPVGPGLFESTRLSASNGVVRFAFARDSAGSVTALSRLIVSGVLTFPRMAP